MVRAPPRQIDLVDDSLAGGEGPSRDWWRRNFRGRTVAIQLASRRSEENVVVDTVLRLGPERLEVSEPPTYGHFSNAQDDLDIISPALQESAEVIS